jgi:hypothetical protein
MVNTIRHLGQLARKPTLILLTIVVVLVLAALIVTASLTPIHIDASSLLPHWQAGPCPGYGSPC